MRKIRKLLCLLLVCVTCASCFVGCKNDKDSQDGSQNTGSSVSTFSFENCKIIYGEGDRSTESASAMSLRAKINEKFGVNLAIGTDYLDKGASYDSCANEILVGHTNYPQSIAVQDRVTRLDYLIKVDGNKVILMAGSAESLTQCVEYFINNYIASEDGKLKLSNTEEHLELYNYPIEETAARIISLNLRYAKNATENNQSIRAPRIYSMVKSAKPDSIGVQECEQYWRQQLEINLGAIGYECAQEEAITASNDYAFKNFIWYNTATTKLVDSGRIWLSETPNTPSKGFGSRYYISAAWALLENKNTGAQYVHFNLHLDADTFKSDPDKEMELRLSELSVLMEKIKPFKENGYDIFITGDFNSNMSSKAYSLMTEKFLDARKKAPETTNLYTYNGYRNETDILDPKNYTCIDFCFYKQSVNVVMKKFNVIDKYGGGYMSDHNALIIDFTLYER